MKIEKVVKSNFSGIDKTRLCATITFEDPINEYLTIYFGNCSTEFILFITYLDIFCSNNITYHIDAVINHYY